MKKLLLSLTLTFTSLLCFSTASLVGDIYSGSESSIEDWKDRAAKINNQLIFAANDTIVGKELYIMKNDTVELLKDLIPGAQSSDPDMFVSYNNKVYFSAKNASGEYDIYVTDGTSNGTNLAITVSADRHVEEFFVAKNGKLYINIASKLYVSEGTDLTTSEIVTTDYINFDNSWTWASTNIVNYKNGVAFHGYLDGQFTVYYHNGGTVVALHTFTADTFSELLGPVACATGLIYGVQDSFDDDLVKTYHISTSNVVTELMIDNASIDLQRIYEVNGEYALIKPFGKGFYAYDGFNFELLSGPGDNFSLYQGERLPHAVVGNKLFYYGEEGWFDRQYFITNGTAQGTNPVKTPETPYPARNILVEGDSVYMIQGTSNNFDATIIKVDMDNGVSYDLFTKDNGPISGEMELAGVVNGEVFFFANLNANIGYEMYNTKPAPVIPPVPGYNFHTSGTETLVSCDTTIYDDGGYDGDYSSDIDATLILQPDQGTGDYKIAIEFIEFHLEDGWDKLHVTYNSGFPSNFTGSSLPASIVSTNTDGSIELRLESDWGSEELGFRIKVTCESLVGFDDLNTVSLDLYPNPSNGSVNYTWNHTAGKVSVSDLSGREVYSTPADSGTNTIDLNHLENGVYHISITDGVATHTEKLIINK